LSGQVASGIIALNISDILSLANKFVSSKENDFLLPYEHVKETRKNAGRCL
jgi:hypothetical protein